MAWCLLTGSAQKAIQQNQVPSIQHKNSATSGTISKCKSDMFLLCKGIKHELKEIRIIHVKKSEVLLDNGHNKAYQSPKRMDAETGRMWKTKERYLLKHHVLTGYAGRLLTRTDGQLARSIIQEEPAGVIRLLVGTSRFHQRM
jgi:hypothetical protein